MKNYLGLNIGIHDSSAVIIQLEDKKLLNTTIYLTERYTKIKHAGLFPYPGVKGIKNEFPEEWKNVSPANVAMNSFNLHSFDFEKKLVKDMPLHEDLIALHGIEKTSSLTNPDLRFMTHHWCHAYSTMAYCPYDKAIIIVSDGVGNRKDSFDKNHPEYSLCQEGDLTEVESLSVYLMDKGALKPIYKKWIQPNLNKKGFKICDGLGPMFENTSHLIFGKWDQAGKVMGLAAYGTATPIKNRVEFSQYLSDLHFVPLKGKTEFDQLSKDKFQFIADLSASIQAHFEENMLELLSDLKSKHSEYDNLVLAGGCALNCLLNDAIIKKNIFKNVFVPPFPNDEGIALGAALAIAHMDGNWELKTTPFSELTPALSSRRSSTESQEERVEALFKDFSVSRPENLEIDIAKLLASGEIVAWMQGRPEVGPRALGQRSILVRPDRVGIKRHLNEFVKFREDFRPYGATILAEKVHEYFEVESNYKSPFMTFAPKIREEKRSHLGDTVHQDGTCRVQTLEKNQNPKFYALLSEFHNLTSVPVLLNTSLNIMGQPILESIDDALKFFQSNSIKYLVFGNYLISKKEAK